MNHKLLIFCILIISSSCTKCIECRYDGQQYAESCGNKKLRNSLEEDCKKAAERTGEICTCVTN